MTLHTEILNTISIVENNLTGSIENLQDNQNGLQNQIFDLSTKIIHPSENKLIYSYANILPNIVLLENYYPNYDNVVDFNILKTLVQPGTDISISPLHFISITGVSYGNAFHEKYTLHLDNGDNLTFSGLYSNTGSGVSSSDAIVNFSVLGATGSFKGATRVQVEYTSNEFKSRFITIHFD